MSEYTLHRIDPADCGCTDCLVGYSKPLGRATRAELLRMYHGLLQNATYISNDELRRHVVHAEADALMTELVKCGASPYLTDRRN